MKEVKNVAALFDFDGVVVDTEGQYTRFWDEQGSRFISGMVGFGRKIKGQTLNQIYDAHFKDMENEQQEMTRALNVFEETMTFDYIPGVVDFMKELRSKGVKIAIVTSSNNVKMEKAYAAHPELKGLVDTIFTADNFTKSKPDPECFLLAAKQFGVDPENCVVFEDSYHGLEAGRSAGMYVVGLSTTNSESDIVDKCNAVIPHFVNYTIEKMGVGVW